MKLLKESELDWSPVVANSRMNRQRNASGINSYEQEFKFRPEIFLETKATENGHASWMDLCCGEGRALLQTAIYFQQQQLQDVVSLNGIDLLDSFISVPGNISCLEFQSMSLLKWMPEQRYDLITCVHGLHYIGDKMGLVEIAVNALNPGGLFIANFDLNNVVINNNDAGVYLKRAFKELDIDYNQRSKILRYTGAGNVSFKISYVGADDTHGPNYTGQDSVTSHYTT
ncbi:MAG: methyltransferase domain-containing protein [Ferruginibacter sp.]